MLAYETSLGGELRAAFPNAQFSVACTPEEISSAEMRLGLSLPNQLRVLYLESDGFFEKSGIGLSSLSYLVHETEKLWGMDQVLVDEPLPDFKRFVFFGTPFPGGWLGIRYTQPFAIVSWLPNEPEVKALGTSVIDVLKAEHTKYENSERR